MTKTNIQEWENRFGKYYGSMFECGDFENLIDDIRQLLQSVVKEIVPGKIDDERKMITSEERKLTKDILKMKDIDIDIELLHEKVGFNNCRFQVLENAKKLGIKIK